MPLAWLGLGFSLGLFWGASAALPPLGLALLLLAVAGVERKCLLWGVEQPH